MTAVRIGRDADIRDTTAVAEFLSAFFGPGNTIDYDPESPMGQWLAGSFRALHAPSDVPVVLPRRRPEDENRRMAYVIARDRRHVSEVGELLRAFVGPTYAYFAGRPHDLDGHDPVERAVLDLVGEGVTFVLTSADRVRDRWMWKALAAMQRAVEMRPARLTTLRRPVGRLLAEFDAALAAGESSASAGLLDQLATDSGLSGPNLAHLRIKRLARLGRDGELLRLPDLIDVIAAQPPLPVIDDVLTALFTTVLRDPLEAGDLQAARAALLDRGDVVPTATAVADSVRLSPQAIVVLTLAAWIRDAQPALRAFLRDEPLRASLLDMAPLVVAELERALIPAPEPTPSTSVAVPSAAPGGWVELIEALNTDAEAARSALAEQRWREWPPPVRQDRRLAAALDTLDDLAAERAWRAVGAFLDADGYRQPAAASARALVTNAMAYGRYQPGDLAALVALVDIVLRAAPTAADYAGLLEDLRADSSRWIAPERSTVLLDLVDLLARHACPDEGARLGLVTVLLEPLHRHVTRLDADQSAFAAILSAELATGLDWLAAQPDAAAADDLTATVATVLLYSLDEGALERVKATLGKIAPRVRVVLSAETDGSPRLRAHSRNADVVVLATRCATHAATGFIRSHTDADAPVVEADGSGSASLLRAAVAGLHRLPG